MKQEFVYHTLTRPEARARRAKSTAVAASATEAVKEYVAYVGLLAVAVAIAIMTFAFAAKITVHWLDAISKPGYFAADAHPAVSPAATGWSASVTPVKFAMLPASAQRKSRD